MAHDELSFLQAPKIHTLGVALDISARHNRGNTSYDVTVLLENRQTAKLTAVRDAPRLGERMPVTCTTTFVMCRADSSPSALTIVLTLLLCPALLACILGLWIWQQGRQGTPW
ncbi:hypothetical protein [Deinococcus maricopensis]|uniref:Uncharacterized protein n=1 Tax=Deinococcus maricopensis (strain DSM 21211 / LMG 22137 / NRRL B-23946 / LB-34) TaxID=709986 RepID=E8U7U3_DEIML|nr:hypothetical protein [Deinococcus maricopensis]ADV67132.1 hypothetical protein Deima_1483 [Deinococcus maricopensis DSM 21211]